MLEDLTALAEAVTAVALAVLTLLGAAVLTAGTARAWAHRRVPQVVVPDVVAGFGLTDDGVSSTSTQFRQLVHSAVLSQSRSARSAVFATVQGDIAAGLLTTGGALTVAGLTGGLRTSVQDSLATLTAGAQALLPDRAGALTALMDALLPAQRGWQVRVVVVRSSSGRVPRVGLLAEEGRIGHAPDEFQTFWLPLEQAPGAPVDDERVAALVDQLLEPTALWLATRLVARQLREGRPARPWSRRRRDRHDEITGLRRLLAGQLYLYVSRADSPHRLAFAEQALEDVSEAERLIPYYSRPHQTAAECLERIGWARRLSGDVEEARRSFARAVDRYDLAIDAVEARRTPREDQDATLARLRVRRTKCRLLSDDPANLTLGQAELRSAVGPQADADLAGAADPGDLYNASCLLALAADHPHLPDDLRETTSDLAWELLGLALLAFGRAAPWRHTLQDEELVGLDLDRRTALVAGLRAADPAGTPMLGAPARAVVRRVLASLPAPSAPTPHNLAP